MRTARLLLATLILPLSFPAYSQVEEDLKTRVERLEASLQTLQAEQAKARLEKEIPQSVSQSFFGFGPAFSKVYFAHQPLSIGATAELLYQGKQSENDSAGVTRFRTFIGHRLASDFVFNSSLAIDIAPLGREGSGGAGSNLHLDFMYVDWLIKENLVLRTGLVPVPLGQRRLAPEPSFYPDPLESRVEQYLLPSDASRPGLIAMFAAKPVHIHLGAVASPEAKRMQTANFAEASLAARYRNDDLDEMENFAVVTRVDFLHEGQPRTRVINAGIGYMYGDVAHRSSGVGDAVLSIIETHLNIEWDAWQLIGLAAIGDLSNTEGIQSVLNVQPGSRAKGWNVSLYRELYRSDEPASLLEAGIFGSAEGFELDDAPIGISRAARGGVLVRPIPNFVFKAAHQWRLGSSIDDDLWQISLGALF